MRLLWISAVFAPLSLAFYPYHVPAAETDNSTRISSRAIERNRSPINRDSRRDPTLPTSEEDLSTRPSEREVQRARHGDESIRVNLRRVITRRKNNFNIKTALDPKQANSLGIDQDGTDFSYFSAFKIGSSQKEYYLLLDSAASNSWVMGSQCSSAACAVHNTFGLSDSSSLTLSKTAFSLAYGTGSVKGVLGTDTLHFSTISVPLTFGLGEEVSNDFLSYPMDGILGLGRPDSMSSGQNGVNAPSFMDVLIAKKIISSKFFGIDIWRNSDGGDNDGEINFGAPDPSRYDGGLNYIPAITNSNGFWEIPVDNAGVGGKSAGLTGRSAIIDSGTSLILMPKGDAAKLHNLIPGSSQNDQAFTIPCSTTSAVQITFGGISYDISAKDYVGRALGGGACSSNIVGMQTFGATQWLVGDVFLKNVYAGFDYDGARVGFGVKTSGIASGGSISTDTGSTSTYATSAASTPPLSYGTSSSIPATSFPFSPSTAKSSSASPSTSALKSTSTPTFILPSTSTSAPPAHPTKTLPSPKPQTYKTSTASSPNQNANSNSNPTTQPLISSPTTQPTSPTTAQPESNTTPNTNMNESNTQNNSDVNPTPFKAGLLPASAAMTFTTSTTPFKSSPSSSSSSSPSSSSASKSDQTIAKTTHTNGAQRETRTRPKATILAFSIAMIWHLVL